MNLYTLQTLKEKNNLLSMIQRVDYDRDVQMIMSNDLETYYPWTREYSTLLTMRTWILKILYQQG